MEIDRQLALGRSGQQRAQAGRGAGVEGAVRGDPFGTARTAGMRLALGEEENDRRRGRVLLLRRGRGSFAGGGAGLAGLGDCACAAAAKTPAATTKIKRAVPRPMRGLLPNSGARRNREAPRAELALPPAACAAGPLHGQRCASARMADASPAVDNAMRRGGLSSEARLGASVSAITSPAPASSKKAIGTRANRSSISMSL